MNSKVVILLLVAVSVASVLSEKGCGENEHIAWVAPYEDTYCGQVLTDKDFIEIAIETCLCDEGYLRFVKGGRCIKAEKCPEL